MFSLTLAYVSSTESSATPPLPKTPKLFLSPNPSVLIEFCIRGLELGLGLDNNTLFYSLLDTFLCSLNIFLQIIMEVTDPTVIFISQIIFTTDCIIASLNLACIGLARVIKHVKPDLYLDLGTDYNWNLVMPVNIILAVVIQGVTFIECETMKSQCFEITITIIMFLAFLLHLVVWLHLLFKYYRGQAEIMPYNPAPSNDIINFSVGSYTLLILALVVNIDAVTFLILKLPFTSVSASICQLLNITIVSIFWTFSTDRIKKAELKILRNFFYQDNSFTVHV